MTTCPKCQHVRNPNDDPNVPEYQCPECAVIYKKYLAKLSESFADIPENNKEKKIKEPENNEYEDNSESTNSKEKQASHPNPKLAYCKDCGEEVSKTANKCSYCGVVNPGITTRENILTWIVVCAIFLFVFSMCSGNETKSTQDCKKDLICRGDKYVMFAGSYCERDIEKLAKYSYKWTDGWGLKFTKYRWKNKQLGYVTFIGDKIQFQNGFGAFQNYIYECDFDPESKKVLGIRVRTGYL